MERATIHSEVGVINGLKLSIYRAISYGNSAAR
jgi:hypothetical protein